MTIARSSTPDASEFEARSPEEDRQERSCSASGLVQVCACVRVNLISHPLDQTGTLQMDEGDGTLAFARLP